MVVVLDNVRSLYNTGAFFRTADACAIERLVLCGITPRPDQGRKQQRAIAKTALGAELTVRWEYQADTSGALLPRMRPLAITSSRSKRSTMRPTCMTGRRRGPSASCSGTNVRA